MERLPPPSPLSSHAAAPPSVPLCLCLHPDVVLSQSFILAESGRGYTLASCVCARVRGSPCEPHVSSRVASQLTGRTHEVLWTRISDPSPHAYLPQHSEILLTLKILSFHLSRQHLHGIFNPSQRILDLMSSHRGMKQVFSGFPALQLW